MAILNRGDAFVAIPASKPGSVRYATDGGDGQRWESVEVGQLPGLGGLELQGLFVHPAHSDARALFALGGEAAAGATLAALDLSAALRPPCARPDDPGAAASDFERWSPADALEDAHASKRPACLLGARTRYVRRKAGRACRTAQRALAPAVDARNDAPCQCVAADWACDEGFYRAAYVADARCEPLAGATPPNASALCEATTIVQAETTRPRPSSTL